MADDDQEIELGELCAQHIGRVIQLRGDCGYQLLADRLLDIRHREGGYRYETELTVVWEPNNITINCRSAERAVVIGPDRTILRAPEWGVPPSLGEFTTAPQYPDPVAEPWPNH